MEVGKMKEIWKDIVGYEGLYQISNLGNVMSLNYRKRGYSQILVPKKNNRGYLWVELKSNGKRKCMTIHRLVANAFLDNSSALPLINHKDENPINNRVDNLEWCDNSYNVLYSLKRHERKARALRNGKIVRKPTKYKQKVIQLTKSGDFVRDWESIQAIHGELGYNNTSITECCKRIRKTAYGYKWRFAE